jgi:carboxypeptidase Taq
VSAYQELLRLYRERALLESCASVLEWDAEAVLPAGGVELRSEQQALLARLEHERAADPRLGDLLAEAESRETGALERANLRELRREHDRALAVPGGLIEEMARETTLAQGSWEQARERGDAAGFLPHLERVVGLAQSHADCLRGAAGRYDACLEQWEPGLSAAEIDRLLTPLRARIVDLINRIEDRTGADRMARPVAPEVQRQLVTRLIARLGFDLERGRLDEAAHPSTVRIGPGDVRLTTRFVAEQPMRSLFTTLHELGHGLYDQNLPPELFGTPVGEAASVAMHEGQARLIENLIGRSRAFWRWFLPQLAAAAPAFADLDPETAYRAVNRVARSARRSGADEVTYDLHIAIRTDLERALIEGQLRVADLPAAWDEAYAALLAPPRDPREGFLQDSHWAAGMLGYFPTYTLGNLIAAQLFPAAPAVDESVEQGSLAPLLDWLRGAVYCHGGLLSCGEMVERATGAPLSIEPHMARLEAKYCGER